MRLPKPTRDIWAETALRQLQEAQRTRQAYNDLLDAAILAHGDITGTHISGIYADHFPDAVKNDLRTYAHNIGVQVDYAVTLWQRAGRRLHTLRPYLAQARILADGRVSYY